MTGRELEFTKMEGAGNDYVYVDAIRRPFDSAAGPRVARWIADRHYGVGGDGLILLTTGTQAPVRMLMWNADGSRGAMCGNGLRCLAKLAYDHGHVRELAFAVETDVGVRPVTLLTDAAGAVHGARVEMGAVAVAPEPAPFAHGGSEWRYHACDVGNPHAVLFVDEDPERVPVAEVGRAMQLSPRFRDGVNVEFVQVVPPDRLLQRTWERGSGETLACGSGAVAAAAAALATGRLRGPRVRVQLRGGELAVIQTGSTLAMEGPARTVFSGRCVVPELQ